jgi:hypothetical protein
MKGILQRQHHSSCFVSTSLRLCVLAAHRSNEYSSPCQDGQLRSGTRDQRFTTVLVHCWPVLLRTRSK